MPIYSSIIIIWEFQFPHTNSVYYSFYNMYLPFQYVKKPYVITVLMYISLIYDGS